MVFKKLRKKLKKSFSKANKKLVALAKNRKVRTASLVAFSPVVAGAVLVSKKVNTPLLIKKRQEAKTQRLEIRTTERKKRAKIKGEAQAEIDVNKQDFLEKLFPSRQSTAERQVKSLREKSTASNIITGQFADLPEQVQTANKIIDSTPAISETGVEQSFFKKNQTAILIGVAVIGGLYLLKRKR